MRLVSQQILLLLRLKVAKNQTARGFVRVCVCVCVSSRSAKALTKFM